MYSILNILLIILSYQCITTECNVQNPPGTSHQDVADKHESQRPTNEANVGIDQDCFLKTVKENIEYMPVPFAINSTTPYIIHPDQNGQYHFKHNTTFKMSCVGTYFKSPQRLSSLINEISIKCVNGFLMYNNRPYLLDHFKCNKTPRTRLVITDQACQGNAESKVVKVGFYSTFGYIPIYKICFDNTKKNALYSWMFMKAPIYKYRQVSDKCTRFVRTANYGRTSIVMSYGNQSNTLSSILGSEHVADKYIRKRDGVRFLIPCQLAAKNLLYYVFENDATYYYENTAPQWIEFNRHAWKELEKLFRNNLVRGNRDHIIVTGTYKVVTLKDVNGTDREFHLRMPSRLSVPKYFWKMYYDVEMKSGTVFIGLNNPYSKVDPNAFFCETIKCPGQVLRKSSNKSAIFCCTKDSFEKVYGKLDPMVFERTVPKIY